MWKATTIILLLVLFSSFAFSKDEISIEGGNNTQIVFTGNLSENKTLYVPVDSYASNITGDLIWLFNKYADIETGNLIIYYSWDNSTITGTQMKNLGNTTRNVTINSAYADAGVSNESRLLATGNGLDNRPYFKFSDLNTSLGGDWSVGLWVKPGTAQPQASTDIFSTHGTVNEGWYMEGGGVSGNYTYAYHYTSAGIKTHTTHPIHLSNNVWQHIVITREGVGGDTTELKVYVDGKLNTTKSQINSQVEHYGSFDMSFGNIGTLNINRSFNGSIDEFFIVNETLNLSTIQNIYNFPAYHTRPPELSNVSLKVIEDTQIFNNFYDNQTQVILNVSRIQTHLNNDCDCTGCVLTSGLCYIPLQFTTTEQGTLWFNLTRIDYYKQFFLIDERTNEPFDEQNLSSVKMFWDDNSSFFDFKAQGVNQTNLTINDDKYRLELIYSDGSVINRYIDSDILPRDIRICANEEGTTHYEQLLISTTEKEAILRNEFADCYVSGDFTRFGYQDSSVLKAFTIAAQYQLTTIVNGIEVLLIGLDGSIASFVNIDTLQLRQDPADIDYSHEGLHFSKTGATTMQIYYKNDDVLQNNDLSMSITRLDTNAEVFTKSDFANNNEFTVYFDYSTLSGVNDSTLFKVDLTKTNSDGTDSVERYFDTAATVGFLTSAVAAAIALLLMVFGLTFTVSRLAFSWFGVFMLIGAIVVLAAGVLAWYSYFLMAMAFVQLIYVILVMSNQNAGTLAG